MTVTHMPDISPLMIHATVRARAAHIVDTILDELHSFDVGPQYHDMERFRPEEHAEMRTELIDHVERILANP